MTRPAYKELRELVEAEKGTMVFQAGGAGGGGDWMIQYRGHAARIRDTQLNPLDHLYEPKATGDRVNDPPAEWGDFTTRLVDGAASRLEKIVRENPEKLSHN
ncbi:MAG TPA: hypothetical protein VGG06_25190 [Thermoanaerobaculia bacterium]|jgi:hypothetical protein